MIASNKDKDYPDLYTLKEAAEFINVLSVNILRRMIKDGQIKGYRFGYKLYVTKEDVIRAVYGEDT